MHYPTDLFIASAQDVRKLDVSQSPVGRLPGFQADMVDPVKLAELLCCVDGSRFEDHFEWLESSTVRQDNPNDPAIFETPPGVTELLAKAQPAELDEYAQAWAETGQWIADGGTPEVTLPIVFCLAELSRRAQSEGKKVYVWMCV